MTVRLTNKKIRRMDFLFQRRTRLSLLAILSTVMLGSVVLSKMEGYTFISSLYLAVQTLTVSIASIDR